MKTLRTRSSAGAAQDERMDVIGVDPYNLMVVLNHVFPTKRLRAIDVDRQFGIADAGADLILYP